MCSPRLRQIKRCVTDGKGPSSRQSVPVCSRAAHSISAAKWVNRVRSVQLPPHCRGVQVGIARGRTGVFGVRWICLRILWFECQFVSTAAPKISRGKKLEPPPSQKKSLQNGAGGAASYPCDCYLGVHRPRMCTRSGGAVLGTEPVSMTALPALPPRCGTFKDRATTRSTTARFSSAALLEIHPLSGSRSYGYEFWTHFLTEQQCNIYLSLH